MYKTEHRWNLESDEKINKVAPASITSPINSSIVQKSLASRILESRISGPLIHDNELLRHCRKPPHTVVRN
jgi:hypothetical protein